MLLTENYKMVRVKAVLRLPERSHSRNSMGWVADDNEYLDIYDNGGSHLAVLKKFGVILPDEYNDENYIRALPLGSSFSDWESCRL
jgi:hypothetical protein